MEARRPYLYILDAAGEPEPTWDVLAWGRWFETRQTHRIVRQSELGPVLVSTVFLGVDHGWGDRPPLLWETLVFGGKLDGK